MITYGKRETKRMATLLDGDFESAEDAATAALDLALEIFENRGKFVVVGQIYYTPEGGWVDAEDATASKVSLGLYSTPGDAQKAAESLTTSTSTHEEARAWVLPVHWGTPASWYMKRKKEREEKMKKKTTIGKVA